MQSFQVSGAGNGQPSATKGATVTVGDGETLWGALGRGAHTAPKVTTLVVAEAASIRDTTLRVRYPYAITSERSLEDAFAENLRQGGWLVERFPPPWGHVACASGGREVEDRNRQCPIVNPALG